MGTVDRAGTGAEGEEWEGCAEELRITQGPAQGSTGGHILLITSSNMKLLILFPLATWQEVHTPI